MSASKQFRAQGLVELAIALPLLLLLILGVFEFSRAFYMKVILENSAREAAHYMIYNATEGKANGFALAKAAAQIEAQNSGVIIPVGEIQIHCQVGLVTNNACPGGSMVVVTIQHPMDFMLMGIFTGPVQLTNEARMLVP